MAMFITKQRAQTGPVFGMVDKFEGLGIFIDTYKNNRPGVVFPYIMAMLGDGQTSYDKDNDGKANELAGCSVRFASSRQDTRWDGMAANIGHFLGPRSPQLPSPD
jgi:Legume-like lectin family